MKTLSRYIGREVLVATVLVFIGLVLLFGFFDLINELGDLGKGRSIASMFVYVGLRLPSRGYELAPVAALIGSLFALSQLVANSEFTVMRVSGLSLYQVGRTLVITGIPFVLFTLVLGEFIAPPAERLAADVKNQMRNQSDLIAQQFSSGFWFKEDNSFTNIRQATSSHVLLGVRVYKFDQERRLLEILTAERGVFSDADRAWKLENVNITDFNPDSSATSTALPVYLWKTVLRPSILTVYQTPPEQLEISTLWTNISILDQSAQDTSRFWIALYSKLVYPVNILLMILLALPFSQFQRRQSGVGFRLFAGAIIGLAFFLVGRLFSYIGTLNNWYPPFAAFAPTVIFLAILIGMMKLQDRR
jgi:lipopolysaccharide export system permease protein